MKTTEMKKTAGKEVAKMVFDSKPSNNIFFEFKKKKYKIEHTPPSDPVGQMVDEA